MSYAPQFLVLSKTEIWTVPKPLPIFSTVSFPDSPFRIVKIEDSGRLLNNKGNISRYQTERNTDHNPSSTSPTVHCLRSGTVVQFFAARIILAAFMTPNPKSWLTVRPSPLNSQAPPSLFASASSGLGWSHVSTMICCTSLQVRRGLKTINPHREIIDKIMERCALQHKIRTITM